jgi:hypothetical protein
MSKRRSSMPDGEPSLPRAAATAASDRQTQRRPQFQFESKMTAGGKWLITLGVLVGIAAFVGLRCRQPTRLATMLVPSGFAI